MVETLFHKGFFMATIHIIGTGIVNGYSTINPTEGNPSGQKINYVSEGRSLKSDTLDYPSIETNFGIPIIDISRPGVLVDGSATILSSNVNQQIFGSNYDRSYLYIQNKSNDNMYVDFGVTANTSSSFKIPASGNLIFDSVFIPDSTVNIICATSGAAFVAKEA
jgi:hypothetical protein